MQEESLKKAKYYTHEGIMLGEVDSLKVVLEFNRYKQDCRKRALEMAHNEIINLTAASSATKGGDVDVAVLAEKYYQWLISIPE